MRFFIALAAILSAPSSPAQVVQPATKVGPPAPRPISRVDYLKALDGRFNSIDSNHDGKLSAEELAAEQQKELQQARLRLAQLVQARFRALDTNHDGVLSLQEFEAIAPPVRAVDTPEQMLARLDTNHDGKISPDEFRTPEIGKFDRADANHDGVVTPAEAAAAAARK